METGLAGKTVIVTGGNSNIGRGISLAFAKEGAQIAIAARDADAAARVEKVARALGAADVLFVKTDVLDREQINRMVEVVVEKLGPIDVLVNNVGGNVDVQPFWETTPEQTRQEIDLTLMSTLDCTRAVLPGMIERRAGRIINIGSTAGITGDSWMTPYSAAKGGVHAFTAVLAREVGQFGITVNTVAPRGTFSEDPDEETSSGSRWNPKNPIMTQERIDRWTGLETQTGRDPARDKTVLGKALGRGFLRPAEVGAAAVFLAADSSAFTTGQVFVIDGGLTLGA